MILLLSLINYSGDSRFLKLQVNVRRSFVRIEGYIQVNGYITARFIWVDGYMQCILLPFFIIILMVELLAIVLRNRHIVFPSEFEIGKLVIELLSFIRCHIVKKNGSRL